MADPGAAGPVRKAVLAAHQGFYDAIETGDLDLMASLWADDDASVCVHPGTEAITGSGAIRRSWAMVMAQLGYVQFILTDVTVALVRDAAGEPVTAVVGCTENVLSEAPDGTDAGFAGGRAVATKTLVRAAGGWKVLSHHASPVLMPDEDDEDDE
ncbi:MAG: nuclear transport factor 2 family protein [Nocardioidaceae bacterium]|nr:nuclear transport factor 2 family protein [Nocardioidaceae bacterium]